MSGFVQWIGAQADQGDPVENLGISIEPAAENESEEAGPNSELVQNLRAHNFPSALPAPEREPAESGLDRDPDLWLYRKRTTALLRRYVRLALETGRLPSVIGREMFRAKITAYTATSFEDRVIFVHDVEKCLERLSPFDQKIIARIVLQEFDHERGARMLHCTRKTLERRLPELLDELSEEFLRVRLLTPLPATREENRRSDF